MTSSDPNVTQDFHRALSLLSTNSWGSYQTKSISQEHSNRTTSTTQPITHSTSQCIPVDSSDYWHTDQQGNSRTWISYPNCEDSNQQQEASVIPLDGYCEDSNQQQPPPQPSIIPLDGYGEDRNHFREFQLFREPYESLD